MTVETPTGTDRSRRRRIICKACHQPGEHRGHGWCVPCYRRWAARGRPESGPPAPYEDLPEREYKPRPIPEMCRMKRHRLEGDNLILLDGGGWRCRACHEANRAAAAEREAAEWRRQWDEIHDGHDVVSRRDGRRACRTCIRGDADIDEAAVERAEGGDPPSRLTIAEREAAIVHLRSYGLTYALIAERVGCTLRTAWWTCARLNTTKVGAARKWIAERAA